MITDGTGPRRRKWRWYAAALSGILLALSFPPFNVSGAIFVALAPLLAAVWLHRPVRRAGLFRFFAGYFAGLIYFTTTFWWIGELGPLYNSQGLRLLPLALAAYLALYPAIWAWFAGWLVGEHFYVEPPDPLEPFSRPPLLSSFRNLGIGIVLAAAWTALEWVRGWLMTGFGWNGLGVALHGNPHASGQPYFPYLIQIAEYTGVGGVSFMVVMCNVIGVITILRLRAEIGRTRLRPHFDFTLTIAMVVAVFAHGAYTVKKYEQPPKDAPVLRVCTIQPNISQQLKMGLLPDTNPTEEIANQIANHHLWLQLGDAHLVLWPEAVVPGGGLTVNKDFVDAKAAEVPALLFGTDDVNRDMVGDSYNSAALIIRGRKDVQVYDKIHLVPFGEYLPLRSFFRWLPEEMQNEDYFAGKEPGVFELPNPGVKLAPLICFEDTDGELARQPVLRGAQVLVNLTNDAWFGHSCEPYTHLYNAIFRAIENRRPLIRSANTGISCQVDVLGRVTKWAEPFVSFASSAPANIPYAATTEITFYTRHGELFSKICAALALAALPARIWFTRRRRSTEARK